MYCCPKSPLCSTCSSFSSHWTLVNTHLFTVSIVLPFQNVRYWNHTVVFKAGLFSLSNMNLIFLHGFSWLKRPFFLALNKILLSVPQFVLHSPTEGYFCYFRVLAVMKSFYKHPCTGIFFLVDITFQLRWVNMEEWDCGLYSKNMFSFVGSH